MSANRTESVAPDGGRAWVMSATKFRREQRRHFFLSFVLPTLTTCAGLFVLPRGAFDWFAFVLWLSMWTLVGGFGVSVGFHRLFAHRSFTCSKPLRFLLGALGSMAGQGSVTYWTAVHRRHHSVSDLPGDLHSPSRGAHSSRSALGAFFQGHVGWTYMHDVPKASRYAADLIRDPVATTLGPLYGPLVVAGIILPAMVGVLHWGWQGLIYGAYWGGAVRIALGQQIIWSVNSVCHRFGRRPFDTPDHSTNVWWLALLSFGESWHNNHHQAPAVAQFGHNPQVDLGWVFILLLRKLDKSVVLRGMTSKGLRRSDRVCTPVQQERTRPINELLVATGVLALASFLGLTYATEMANFAAWLFVGTEGGENFNRSLHMLPA
jgi:stearoyl-CoA desaturase (delta-9 desaturase)